MDLYHSFRICVVDEWDHDVVSMLCIMQWLREKGGKTMFV